MSRILPFVLATDADRTRATLRFARIAAVAFGAIQAWASRHTVNPGGVSHLDMTDAVRRGDFGEILNGYFSPLYTLVLAPVLGLVRPGPALEATVVHFVNFLIYLFAMV